MKHWLPFALVLGLLGGQAWSKECSDLLHFSLQKLRGQESVNFCEAYRGKVILAVNTASRCGFTPQFKELEALYQEYKNRGFVVLGFPSDDFKQEYSDAEKTAQVCYINYGVTFPMFAKTSVRGESANAFFKGLAAETGKEPGWNFFKYLIDSQGKVREAFSSSVTPESPELRDQIEMLVKRSDKQLAH